jgi:hypothetical protein
VVRLEKGSGNCLSMLINGLPAPSYRISRSPTQNGGFMLESCWVLYASWPLPRRGLEPRLEDGALTVDCDAQAEEADSYNDAVLAGGG